MVSINGVFIIIRLLFKHHDFPWLSLWSAMMKVTSDLRPKRDVAVQSNEMWRVDPPNLWTQRKCTILLHFLHCYQWVKPSSLHIYLHFSSPLCYYEYSQVVNMVVVNPDGSAMILNVFMIVSSWASPRDRLSSSSLRSALLGCVWLNVLLFLLKINLPVTFKILAVHLKSLCKQIFKRPASEGTDWP